jgi:Ca-activated chloride channel family protein
LNRPKLFACLTVAAALFSLHAQQNPAPALLPGGTPTIRVSVHLVNVFVNVTDANGAPVPGLTRDDFEIKEDGLPQKIALFERETALPLNVVMAIDTSDSVFKDFDLEHDAAHSFLEGLVRPIDRVEVMEFNDAVREVVPFTSNLKHLESGLGNLHRGGATAFYSGVYLGAQALAPRSGRKVLVLISDGVNTVKGVGYPEALEAAVRGEVMVYSIIDVPIEASAGRSLEGEHAMITLAEQTGGRSYYADAGSLQQVFAQVSEDLRTQYLLGYYPPRNKENNDFRTISVTLRNRPADAKETVHHRPGYYPAN